MQSIESSNPCFRVVVSKRRFSQGASISISRMADAIVKWKSEPAFTSTAGGMSGMDGTMICTIHCSYNPPQEGQVMELARYLQEVHFPLLEQPDKTSIELFPEIWD